MAVATVGVAALWMCLGIGRCILLAAPESGGMRLDYWDEIRILGSVLNHAVPILLVGLVMSAVLIAKRYIRAFPYCLLLAFALCAATAALGYWHCIDLAHGDEISLWSDFIWWYFVCDYVVP